MAYVGNTPSRGQWRKLTDISGSFDGVTTTFTTSVPPGTSQYFVTAGTASQLIISLGGVIQEPDVNYSVSTNSITFATPPAAGLSFFGILCGDALNTSVPSDGSITTAKLGGNLTVDLASGSASAPGLTFDSNTGLYSPGEDQVAVSTGGTGRLFINSSGQIGIGTSSPQSALNLGDTSAESGIQLGDGADFTIKRNVASLGVQFNVGADLNNYQFNIGGTERARIDSSGRLLVGTSSAPTTGSLQYSKLLLAGNTVNNGGSQIALTRGQTFNGLASGQDLGYVYFGTFDGGNYGVISCFSDGASTSTSTPGRLTFSTTADGASSPTERMRIANDGTTYARGSTSVFSFASNAGAGTTNWLQLGGHSAASITGYTISYAVYTNGNVVNTNGSYTAISDAKLKENIVDASSQWNDLKAVRIRNWNFKEETGHETHRQIGPIAQELEQVCPGLVFETPDRDAEGNDLGTTTKSVNYSVLYMKAVKALQEAMERIETLEAKVAAFETP